MSTRTETQTVTVECPECCNTSHGKCCVEVSGLPRDLIVVVRTVSELDPNDVEGTHTFPAVTATVIEETLDDGTLGSSGSALWRSGTFDLADGVAPYTPTLGGVDVYCAWSIIDMVDDQPVYSSSLTVSLWCGTPDHVLVSCALGSDGGDFSCDPILFSCSQLAGDGTCGSMSIELAGFRVTG
jgi:hypothetical protein